MASLYACGFVSGAFTSPFTGAFVDKFGRKKAAMLYCVLEMIINYMEQYPILLGLVLSRIIGGVTTNLLCSCFETWLITEHRERGFSEGKLEVILRDSGIVSNSAAILSGVMAHILASTLGPVGPFQGAVATTFVALLLVAGLWTENYGDSGMKTTSIIGHVCKFPFEMIMQVPNISCSYFLMPFVFSLGIQCHQKRFQDFSCGHHSRIGRGIITDFRLLVVSGTSPISDWPSIEYNRFR